MKGKLKKVSTAIALISIGVIVGIAMPIAVKGENGDATSAQVLAGKTFTSSLVSVATSGEMKNLSGKTFATNNPGVSTIDVDDGYYTEIQVDASAVYQAGVAEGQATATAETPTLLWTKPAGGFTAQTITLDLTDYEAVMIEVSGGPGFDDYTGYCVNYLNKTESGKYITGGYQRASYLCSARQVTNINDDGITFGTGFYQSSSTTDNSCAVPMKIYGLKNAII